MEQTINDRMEIIINKYFNGNKRAFERAIGLNQNAISSYVSKQRRSLPNINIVADIIKATGVDAHWLITGEEKPHVEIKTAGDLSPAMYKSELNIGNVAVLKERINSLEAIIKEKERTIQILMGKSEAKDGI